MSHAAFAPLVLLVLALAGGCVAPRSDAGSGHVSGCGEAVSAEPSDTGPDQREPDPDETDAAAVPLERGELATSEPVPEPAAPQVGADESEAVDAVPIAARPVESEPPVADTPPADDAVGSEAPSTELSPEQAAGPEVAATSTEAAEPIQAPAPGWVSAAELMAAPEFAFDELGVELPDGRLWARRGDEWLRVRVAGSTEGESGQEAGRTAPVVEPLEPGAGGDFAGLFTEREIEEFGGDVTEVLPAAAGGLVIKLREPNNHHHRVLLGPEAFVRSSDVGVPSVGARVEIRGVATRDVSGRLWVARELSTGTAVLVLREEDGQPRWERSGPIGLSALLDRELPVDEENEGGGGTTARVVEVLVQEDRVVGLSLSVSADSGPVESWAPPAALRRGPEGLRLRTATVPGFELPGAPARGSDVPDRGE